MTDPLASFAALAPSSKLRSWPTKYTAFCRELGITLSDGQEAFARVAYDGCEPIDLPEHLRELGREIFGPLDRIPYRARRVVVLCAGARGGKSYMAGALRCLHLSLTVPMGNLAPGESGFGIIIAPNPQQRDQCYGYVAGAVEAHPELKAQLVGKAGAESLTLLRKDGRLVTIEGVPAKKGGGAARGRWLACCVLEECAFFQDENFVVNDQDIFASATARVLPGGQVILSSTPWAETGILYTEFVEAHPEPWRAARHLTKPGKPTRAVAAHAPTLRLLPTELNQQIVESERERDPANAEREYDAQFMSLGAAQFFDAARIAQSVDHYLELGSPPDLGPRRIAAQGVDLGFRHDAATGVVVERTPAGYTLRAYIEILPSVEKLKPSEVLARLGEQAQSYAVEELIGDQHYADSAKEAFYDLGLVWIELPGGGTGKADVFGEAKRVMNEGLLRIPNDPRLLEQLREVRKRPLPGGGISIEQPRKPKGGHGDIVSALVAAIWRLSKLQLPDAPEDVPTDPRERQAHEWRRSVEERMARDAARAKDPWADDTDEAW